MILMNYNENKWALYGKNYTKPKNEVDNSQKNSFFEKNTRGE